MKLERVEKIYAAILLVIFGGIVLHAPLSVYLGTLLPDASLVIKSWKEVLMLLAAPFVVILIHRRQYWKELLHDRIVQLVAAYGLIHMLIAAAMLTGPLATVAGLMIDLRYIVFFTLVYVLLKLAPRYARRFLLVAAGGAVIVVGFAMLQLFLPQDILRHIGYGDDTIQPYLTVDENPDFIRVNSTLRGPNPLGAYVVIVMGVLAAAAVRARVTLRNRKSVLFFVAAVAASSVTLWISYSRSALAAAAVTLFLTAVVGMRHLISRRVWIAGVIVLFTLAGGIVTGRELPFVANVIFHENPADTNPVNSNEGHLQSLTDGTERMLRQPIGGGVGSTGSASLFTDSPLVIENQYLLIAHEVGWLGLAVFMLLLAAIFIRLWRNKTAWLSLGVLTSGLGLTLIGLLQPVWVDDTVSIIWWGLAAVALVTGGNHVRQPAK